MADDSTDDTGDDLDPGAAASDVPADESGLADPDSAELAKRLAAEEEWAAQRWSSIEAGRRKGGVAGAAMAGAMLAIRDVYEGPKDDTPVAIAEHPDEPDDIDVDGITVDVDGNEFWAPPPRGRDDEPAG